MQGELAFSATEEVRKGKAQAEKSPPTELLTEHGLCKIGYPWCLLDGLLLPLVW